MEFARREKMRGGVEFTAHDREIFEGGGKVETLQLQISYSKGGTSWVSGNENPRGIAFTVRETTLEKWEHGVTETFNLFGTGPGWGKSLSYMVKPQARRNDKEIERVAALFEPILDMVADAWRDGDRELVKALVYAVDVGKGTAAKVKAAPKVAKPRQKLLTEGIRRSLPKLYSQEDVADPIARVKFFNPAGAGTWFATEFDGEDTFFGLAHITDTEFGYFSLSELESIRGFAGLGIERDTSFTPRPLSEAAKAAGMDWQPRREEVAA